MIRPLSIHLALGALAPQLDVGIGDDEEHQENWTDDQWLAQPGETVAGHGNKKIGLHDFAQDEAEHERRTGPTEQHHEVAEHAENQRNDQIDNLAIGGVAADKNQQQDERDNQLTADVGYLGDLIEDGETQQHGDDIGDGESPNHREGDSEMFGQHVPAR